MKRKVSALSVRQASRAVVEVLEERCLLSAIVPSSSVLVFNSIEQGASGAGPGKVDALVLTNTSGSTVSIPAGGITIANDPSSSTQDASEFAITSGGGAASLAPGQSAVVDVDFTATHTALASAILNIQSNDPTTPVMQISLHGLGTTGTGGANEPSLAAILRAFDIPTIVGDGANDSGAFASTFYPATPDGSSQEVPMQRLVKAGTGPVTITPLASFDVTNNPALRFGYYTPGDPTGRTQLFTIGQADSQTVNPTALGPTSFDPGSNTFGLYANFPTFTDNGQQRISYSEDAFNTWDTTVPRKFRFFPLRNADGTVVPNAYVFAAEDNNKFFPPNIQPYDSNDIVGIIRNVKPAADATGAPVLGLENLDQVPSNTRLVFNRIQYPNTTSADVVHDTNILRIHNSGDRPLVIQGLTLSDTTNWQIVNPPAAGTTVAANGGTLDLTIKFIAQTDPPHTNNQTNDSATTNLVSVQDAGGVWNGTLTIRTNDPVNSSRVVQLAGYWQFQSEHENEPGLQTIVNSLYGYTTDIANAPLDEYPNGSTPTYYGEEVPSGLWEVADGTLPITVLQLAAFHQQFDTTSGTQVGASIGYYVPGSTHTTNLYKQQPGTSQSLLPSTTTSSGLAIASFAPTGTFGWNLDGERSQDNLNTTDISSFGRSGHAVRFWPARDASGNLIPNTWIVGMDYEDTTFDNSDFQDNLYLISNMRPATQAPAPPSATATATPSGELLQWAPSADSTVTSYNIYRATSVNGPYTKIASVGGGQNAYVDATAPSGTTEYYRITAVSSAGESEGTNALLSTSSAPVNTDVLSSVDVNSQPAGSTTVVTPGRDYNITAGGADIGGSAADGFRFAYEPVTGDFDAVVQVSSLTAVNSGSRAGLMVRSTLDAGAQMIFSGASASDGYRFNYRTTDNAVGTFTKYGTVSYPNVWVRLVRSGNLFTGYYSTDGTNWTQTMSLTLAMPDTVYFGLAVASHDVTQTTTAQLRNFSVTTTPVTTPPPPGGGTTPPGGGTPPTLAEQVALDKAAIKADQVNRAAQLKAQRLAVHNAQLAYRAALKALHSAQRAALQAKLSVTSIDPSFQSAVNADLAALQSAKATLATMQKTDFTGIKAARKTLAADQKALRLSLKHKK